jgi:hypothetical protein
MILRCGRLSGAREQITGHHWKEVALICRPSAIPGFTGQRRRAH